MESRYLFFWIVFCFLVWNKISVVQTADTCGNHEDCKENVLFKYCCGSSWLNRTRRTCQLTHCLNKYCATESHCGNPSLCCRSEKCVDRGCSGCASNSECSSGHVCCKKTFPKDETVCAENCIDQDCTKNDDCAGRGECCRDKKCVGFTSCTPYCKDNSECDLGKYCCKKEPVLVFWKGRCRESCVGIECSSNDDCGHPDESCIAGKCSSNLRQESSPPWRIAVIVIAGCIVLGVSIAVYWRYKRNQQSIATQVNRGSLSNIQNQLGTVIANPKPNPQFTGFNNPTQQQITESAPPPPGVDRYRGQRDILDNGGYVISPDETYEYPTVVRVTQRQSDPNGFNSCDNPPPYPGNHP